MAATSAKRMNGANRLGGWRESSRPVWGSILPRHHHSDGRFRGVHVVYATGGNEFHELGAAVVVADVKRIFDAVAVTATAFDGGSEHPEDVPKPPGFVLTGNVRWHGHISVKDAACEKNPTLPQKSASDSASGWVMNE